MECGSCPSSTMPPPEPALPTELSSDNGSDESLTAAPTSTILKNGDQGI